IMMSSGDRTRNAEPARLISIARLINPDIPATDLCGLKRGVPAFHGDTGPVFDEFPEFGLECFTRKSLHLASDLQRRPCHQFESTDGTQNAVCVLFREENAINPILNNFRGAACAKCNDGATASLRLDSDDAEIFASRHDKSFRAPIQVP